MEVVKIVVGVLVYVGIWVALTLAMVRVYQKSGGFDTCAIFIDGPVGVFAIMAFWPLVAPFWFMAKGVQWIAKKMEEDT